MSEKPYLSVVAVSRNDEHGGNTLERTQIFVDSFLDQCARHELRAELIMVEWNPPPDRPPLAEVVSWGRANAWVDCRVITVPYERHIMLNYARKLPLFQMIGKNVGIRRARGEFVLATNIDILFSEELFAFLARKELRSDRMYRCDRFDVDASIRNGTVDEKLDFAWKNVIRKNVRTLPENMATLQQAEAPIEEVLAHGESSGFFDRETDGGLEMLVAREGVPYSIIHLCACGDFTLLHREGWARIGGYAEFDLYSLHIDSLGVHCGHRAGFRETWLAPPAVCFHVEHAKGSGYVEGAAESLYQRLARQGIGWFDYEEIHPYLAQMEENRAALEFNGETWGMRDIPLDETICAAEDIRLLPVGEQNRAAWDAPVTSIRAEFELMGMMRGVMERNRAAAANDHATLTQGVVAYRKAFEDAKANRERLSLELEKQRELAKKLRSDANALRKMRNEDMSRLKEVAGELDAEKRARGELAEKLRSTRAHLARYRRVFGSLERLGLFR